MITIGLPVYNAEAYLELALKSILLQTYTDWKLIIINDGSTDKSHDIIQQFLPNKRILYVNDSNKGLIYRLNQMVQLTETPYFARMDADDVMFPERLATQIAILERNPTLDFVGSSIISIDENSHVVGKRIAGNGFTQNEVLLGHPFVHPTILGKAEWFKKNPYDSKYYRAEDKELWIRTFSTSHSRNIEDPLLFYREGKVNLKSYLASNKTVREIYTDYKSLFDNNIHYRLSILKEFGKDYIYQLFGGVGLHHILTKERSSLVPELEKKYYEELLKHIDGTGVIK